MAAHQVRRWLTPLLHSWESSARAHHRASGRTSQSGRGSAPCPCSYHHNNHPAGVTCANYLPLFDFKSKCAIRKSYGDDNVKTAAVRRPPSSFSQIAAQIRSLAKAGAVSFTPHALDQAVADGFDILDVRHVLERCMVVEDQGDSKYRCEGRTLDGTAM